MRLVGVCILAVCLSGCALLEKALPLLDVLIPGDGQEETVEPESEESES